MSMNGLKTFKPGAVQGNKVFKIPLASKCHRSKKQPSSYVCMKYEFTVFSCVRLSKGLNKPKLLWMPARQVKDLPPMFLVYAFLYINNLLCFIHSYLQKGKK